MPNSTMTMTCPKCGATMNHHANKMTDPVSRDEIAAVDQELGGILQHTFGCPRCGNVESRRAR